MLVLKGALTRSINQTLNASFYHSLQKFKPTEPKNLVNKIRLISTADQKEKKKDDKMKDDKEKDAKKNVFLQEQEEMFKQFSKPGELTLEDKQDKFLDMLFRFKDKNIHYQRLGDCEFILGSLKILKPLNLHRELYVYKELMSVFPKEKMKTTNYYQQMLLHFPKHQETAISILEEMGLNNVFPDKEMRIIVRDIFGGLSSVHRYVLSMNYWNTKMARKSPFPKPDKSIDDKFRIAILGLKKMCCTFDAETKIHKYDSSIATMNPKNNEWILSAQSNNQKELIKRLNENVYVEGPFISFVHHEHYVRYFVLKTKTPNPYEFIFQKGELDVSRLKISTFGRKEIVDKKEENMKAHHQEDGAILATCITEKSSEQSILAWVRILSKLNPNLENVQIMFRIDKDDESNT